MNMNMNKIMHKPIMPQSRKSYKNNCIKMPSETAFQTYVQNRDYLLTTLLKSNLQLFNYRNMNSF